MHNIELYVVAGELALLGAYCLFRRSKQLKARNAAEERQLKLKQASFRVLNPFTHMTVMTEQETIKANHAAWRKRIALQNAADDAEEFARLEAQGYVLFNRFYDKASMTNFRIIELDVGPWRSSPTPYMKLEYINDIGTIKHLTVRGQAAMDNYMNQKTNEGTT